MGETLTIEVRNTRDAVAPASARAEEWLSRFDPAPQALNLVMLSIEELVLNCINYGYDDKDEHMIVIKLSVEGNAVRMTVVDDGHAFNPLKDAPAPDFLAEIEEREAGGLGIHLLRSLADEMTYERRNGTNRLTIVKGLRE